MTEDKLPGYNEIAFLQEAIDCLPNGFAILNTEFLPVQVNRIALEAFETFYRGVERGLSYLEATFESVRAASPEASEEECWQMTDIRASLLTSGKPADINTADGRIFNTVYRPISGDRYVAIAVDVTAQRRMSKALEGALDRIVSVQRASSTFLANLSHEVRTPLNGILGLAQAIERGGLGEDKQREHGQVIIASARSLRTLFDNVTDLAKIEAGQMTLAPVDEDLGNLLAQLQRLWRPLAKEKLLTFSLEIADDLPRRLRFDPVRLGQCVSNLLGNAVKFAETGGVAIRASRYDHEGGVGVSIEVSDTGIGMSAETVDKLFVPFVHGESAFSRHFGGTGLGVVLTQKLARLMGGDLTVTSDLGKGSVLTLTVVASVVADQAAPTVNAADQARDAQATGHALYHGKRILLVDDHPLNRRVGKLYLEPEGFIVSEAVNGQHALDRLAEEPFDLVLMDIHMPVMNGIEALRQIRGGRAVWRDIPVIAFTADTMSGDRALYAAEGMNGYVLKPIEKRDLLAEIGRVLGVAQVEPQQARAARPNSSPAGSEALIFMR
jgi:signal transduction histidine kinase/CheY-like chemotaxis protein